MESKQVIGLAAAAVEQSVDECRDFSFLSLVVALSLNLDSIIDVESMVIETVTVNMIMKVTILRVEMLLMTMMMNVIATRRKWKNTMSFVQLHRSILRRHNLLLLLLFPRCRNHCNF